jgi:CheY-like chemotaxis protein
MLRAFYPYEKYEKREEIIIKPESVVISEEISKLIPLKETTNICQIINNAWNTVKQLAFHYKASFEFNLPQELVLIKTDPAMMQQILINLMSSVIKTSPNRNIFFTMEKTGIGFDLIMKFPQEPDDQKELYPIDPAVDTLIKLLGWSISLNKDRTSAVEQVLHIQVKENLVLVIDDNEGFVQLLERFLSENPVRIISARSGVEGMKMIEEYSPDAIILDVMMANLDGWEVLQRIRANFVHAQTPIIICSVINDSELALSLGVNFFLPKPVKQEEILVALQKIGLL